MVVFGLLLVVIGSLVVVFGSLVVVFLLLSVVFGLLTEKDKRKGEWRTKGGVCVKTQRAVARVRVGAAISAKVMLC